MNLSSRLQVHKNVIRKKVQRSSAVILNPLDVTGFPTHDFTVERKEIVTVGRLEPQKIQKLLINAFSNLQKKFLTIRSLYTVKEASQKGA